MAKRKKKHVGYIRYTKKRNVLKESGQGAHGRVNICQ